MAKRHTLYSPEGVKYETTSKVEATRLRARGYTDQAPKKAEQPVVAPKSDSK